MKFTKWIALFLCSSLLFAVLYASFNMLVDPFGVFGDKLLGYEEYSMTENPRVAKMSYLEDNHDKYDSYIVGCSKTSSYSVELLNRYMNASFFNLFAYGGDMADEEKMVTYVINNYSPKNIVVAMGPEAAYKYDFESDSLKDNLHYTVENGNALSFYSKYAFLHPSYSAEKLVSYFTRSYLPDADAVFNAETGAYDKTVRDNVPIGSFEDYAKVETSKFEITHNRPLKYIDECVASVKRIKELCDVRGVNFMLIASPMYAAEQDCYSPSDMAKLWSALAQVTDFYDFWGYSSAGNDSRYFYDGYHFRNCMGDMALAYIFGDESVYVPCDFGHLTTKDNVSEHIPLALAKKESVYTNYTKRVPILMYHSFCEDDEPVSGAITASSFENNLKALRDNGYTTVLYEDVISYVEKGGDLPEKPVIISIDDGYENNITIAAPLLEKYGMCAVISVIGVSDGKSVYKDTGTPMTPHFSLNDERLKMFMEKGILDIQSHSYDMHMVDDEAHDGLFCRRGVRQMNDESEMEYVTALTEDYLKIEKLISDAVGKKPNVYTYPEGIHSQLSEVVFHSLGAKVTVGTAQGVSEIVRGIPQSLYLLKRINVYVGLDNDTMINIIEANS